MAYPSHGSRPKPTLPVTGTSREEVHPALQILERAGWVDTYRPLTPKNVIRYSLRGFFTAIGIVIAMPFLPFYGMYKLWEWAGMAWNWIWTDDEGWEEGEAP